MNKKALPVIVVLLVVAAFMGGLTLGKGKLGNNSTGLDKGRVTPTTAPQAQVQPTQPPFNPKKSDRPEIKFFVMSFCPYGNQAEDGLEPVYQLLKDKVDWQPRYIVADKKLSCEQSCPNRVFNANAEQQCNSAISQGRVKDMETCKTYFPYKTTDECLQKECAGLKEGEWESLHGIQELNQNVREICAYKQNDLDKWWKFVSSVNKNCTAQNADTCWTKEAQSAGLNTAKISTCAKNEINDLLKYEVVESDTYQASGSPTVFINGTLYNGGRAPEDYKQALCKAFNNPPKECETVLGQASAAAPAGGCN